MLNIKLSGKNRQNQTGMMADIRQKPSKKGKVNQMNATGYHVCDRILSFFLALIMLISSASELFVFAVEDADNTGGFVLSLSWNSDDTNDINKEIEEKVTGEPSKTYYYYSDKNEERIVTLKVRYQNKGVSQYDYEAGKIIITVPGLKGAVRSGSDTSYLPIGVAADKTTDTNKTHDWSYSYSATTDTYTFTNNKKIDAKSTFEGSFEIMWKLPSRETKHDYSKELHAELKAVVSQGEDTNYFEAESNPISYKQERKRDAYTIIEKAAFLYKDAPVDDALDLIWVKYKVTGTDTYYARDVEGSERIDCYFLQGAEVQGAGLQKIEGNIKDIGGETYECWSVEKNVTSNTTTFLDGIYVAYPNDYYGREVKSYVYLYGKYFEEEGEVELAHNDVSVNLKTYGFEDIPGPIYKADKHSYGVKNSYINNHCENTDYCPTYGAINAAHLSGNKHEYESTLELELNFITEQNQKDEDGNDLLDENGKVIKEKIDLEYYDLEFVDDIMDISLKKMGEDGSIFRQLNDNEYHFTRIKIPSNEKIRNKNGEPIKADTYDVEIYYRHANGKFPYNFLTKDGTDEKAEPNVKTKIKSEDQVIPINDNNVVGVKIVIRGIKESFYTKDIRCYYQFNISDEELSKINTDGGQLINNMYFNLYDMTSGTYKWFNDEFTREHYSDDREYDRDITLYEHALDRENATLHILDIPSEFKVKEVKLEETQSTKYMLAYNGSITSEFSLGDGADYSKFSMYTILPEDLQLYDIYKNNPELLKTILSFSSADGKSPTYIAEHTTIEIIPNYKNSGREYLAFHYDFDEPITSKTITVSGIPIYINIDKIEEQSKSYTMYAGMLIDQNGKWFSASTDNFTIDNDIWIDMDYDGDIEEPASFANTIIEVNNPKETHVELVKFVKTSRTNGYVNPAENEEVPMTYAGGEYSYRLRASVGNDIGNNMGVKNFIFFDAIETHEGEQWQGEFVSIDYSAAAEVFGAKPTIYYSTEVEKFEIDETDPHKSYNITPEALNGGKWTTEKPDNDKVRSVAVYFKDGFAESGSVIDIYINMKAPDAATAQEEGYYNQVTVNDCHTGYDKATSIDGQEVVHQNLPSNNVRVKFVPHMGTITLYKNDAVNGKVIGTEAEFELYRKEDDNTPIGTYTTKDGKIIVRDLLYGNYYFKEIEAPKGYELSTEICEVKLNGEKPDIVIPVNFKNDRKKGEITFRKVSDRNENLGLQGAKFNLYDASNNVVREGLITGEDGSCTVEDLEWGTYYLVETEAPAGYEISEEITEFLINAENDAGRELNLVIKNKQKPGYATLTKYELLEDGSIAYKTLEDGTKTEVPLAGAVYELYDENHKLIGTYMTDKDGKIYAEDLAFGKYYFKETIAPKGYELDTEPNEFEVTANHISVDASKKVPAYDKRKLGRVTLLKLDDEEEPVKDAVYGLFKRGEDGVYVQVDKTGKASTETFKTSEEGYIEINDLWWGDYYLKELKAPTGYALNNMEIEFSVNANTVSKRILRNAEDKRQKGKVKLMKYAENDSTKTLEGAVYTLYKNDGSIYRDNLTTNATGTISVEEIPWGSYYFLEKTPPNGYGLSSEKIRFSVNYLTAGKEQELTATDPQISYKLTVTKKIKIEDIVFSHGNPTFTFKVTKDDGTYYHQAVTFSEEYVTNHSTDDGYIEASVIFTLTKGKYTVSEIETNRYQTGEVTAENGTVNDKTATFDIKDQNTNYKATFTNEKTTQEGLSHTSQISNILKRSRKYTALVAVWKGSEIITENQLDRSLLEVYAVYDDGAQEKLADNAYTLNPESFDSSMNGDFTVNVSYTEGSVTRQDTFGVKVDVSDPFTWKLDSTQSFTDADGTKYDGTAIINGYLGSAKVLNIPKSVTGWVELQGNKGVEHSNHAGKKYKVIGVEGENVFSAMYNIENCDTLILPDGLVTIGDNAFKNCSNLTGDLVIRDSVTSIGNSAFESCGFTGSLKLGNKVETIGTNAFQSTGSRMQFSESLVIPDSVTSIESNAFKQCGFTGSLTLGNGVKSIASQAFYNVKFSGGLKIPDSVTSIGKAAFNLGGFTGNLTFGQNSKLKNIGNFAFDQCGFTGSLAIPSTVETIGTKAFFKCSGFNGTLTFGENSNLKTIGDYAFTGRSSTSDSSVRYDIHFTGLLKIPGSVESIGECAFRCDTGFTGLELQEGIKEIGSYAFDGCEGFKGNLTIPNNVTKIGERAFRDCSGFTGNLVIPDSVTEIEMGAFNNCRGLTGSLTLSRNLTKINDSVFNTCKFTGELIIPDTVTEIRNTAFGYCDFSGDVELSANLTLIQKDAFYYCENIDIIRVSSDTTIEDKAFRKDYWGAMHTVEYY